MFNLIAQIRKWKLGKIKQVAYVTAGKWQDSDPVWLTPDPMHIHLS